MIVVDSSGWIEFFVDGLLAKTYAKYLSDSSKVVTPTIVVYEVYKVIKRVSGEEAALAAVAQMGRTRVVPLAEPIALAAADLSLAHGLAMADAIVYATARHEKATLVTSDADLGNLPGATYHQKK